MVLGGEGVNVGIGTPFPQHRLDVAGNARVGGTLFKGGGSFQIDHPVDPANKYLHHSFVESPDMMNIYNGIAALEANGEAVVELPDWFEALNRDFRYQLTCIGGFAPVYIAQKVANNRFKIAGGPPGLEVSWQVTGIRQDAWANARRIPVEEDKPAARARVLSASGVVWRAAGKRHGLGAQARRHAELDQLGRSDQVGTCSPGRRYPPVERARASPVGVWPPFPPALG